MTKPSSIEPFLKNAYEDRYLYSVNRNTFTKSKASEVFNKYFPKLLKEESTFYIFVGSDSGLLVNYLLENNLPAEVKFLFIELDKVFSTISSHIPKSNNKVQITDYANWLETARSMNIDAYIFKQKTRLIKSLCATDLFESHYFHLYQDIESKFQEYSFQLLSIIGGFEFIKNQLINVSENIIPATVLKNSLLDKVAIVLAGGPSLDKNISWITKNQDNLVIIAASRISKQLIKANLIPDIVVSVDPKHNSFEVSRELLLLPPSVLFAHTMNVYPGLISQWHGKSVYIGELLPWKSKLNIENFNGEGPTVTNTAISLAYLMGIKNILLAGVDLCYSREGQSHASGSIEQETIGTNLSFIGKNVTTYTGEVAQTTAQMALAAEMLNIQAKEYLKYGINLINLSENSARCENIQYHPTCNLTFTETKGDVQGILDKLVSIPEKKFRKKHNTQLLTEVQSLILDCHQINKLSNKALKHNNLLFARNTNDEEKYFHKTKIDRIEKQLNSKFKVAATFVKKFNLQLFINCIPTSDMDDWDDQTTKKTGDLYYQAYFKGSELAIKHLREAQNRITSRISELASRPNLVEIFKQWDLDNQPGRYRILESSNQIKPVDWDKTSKDLLLKSKNKFQEIITGETSFKKYLEKSRPKDNPTKGVYKKIKLLFNQKDKENLEILTENLFVLANKHDKAAPLFYLAQGYLLSLEKKYEDALHSFEEVSDTFLNEDEFKHIANLALKLKLPELAESALSALINFNEIYLPLYGNFLKIIGKTEAAIEAYTQYLSHYRNDVYNWVKLGQLFMLLNAQESADMVFKQVLAIEPDNKIAQEYIDKISSL
ncbi:6-hydroxymethylpterin diphosphokinase MptE-like protein [Thalassotalea sp. G2M2-11]|uniref:6-hydroxymethylpterin diphosphokinase MptE-like protein n=1 Tax=Thalassotalea sp. G2M2-11 TaxID=2787627 RepID=UPI0019D26DE8|nr:6-hydroxymethylpterin diphosphokinase MptE-like protein [Thalassotalea sp. G2M2-11]